MGNVANHSVSSLIDICYGNRNTNFNLFTGGKVYVLERAECVEAARLNIFVLRCCLWRYMDVWLCCRRMWIYIYMYLYIELRLPQLHIIVFEYQTRNDLHLQIIVLCEETNYVQSNSSEIQKRDLNFVIFGFNN